MIKKVCYCDRCGAVAEKAVSVYFNQLDIDSGDIGDEWPGMPGRVDLCEGCAEAIHDMIMTMQGENRTAVKEPKAEKRKKIDRGRIMALRNANWSVKKIADDTGLTPSQVSGVLNQEKKRLEKEAAAEKEDSGGSGHEFGEGGERIG